MSTWMLDLTDMSWKSLANMPGPRYDHGCSLTLDGELMIAGGSDENNHHQASVHIYNIANNRAGKL